MSRIIFNNITSTPTDTDVGAGGMYLKDDLIRFKREANQETTILEISGGYVGIGTTVPDMALTINGTDGPTSKIRLIRNTADTAEPGLNFVKSRGATVGSNAIVQDDDNLGGIYFYADDGTDFESYGVSIIASVDGAPGSNDMPGRLTFGTTSDGGVGTTERMRIDSAGQVGIGTSAPLGQLHIQHDTNTGMASANHIFGIQTGGISISAVPIAKAWVSFDGTAAATTMAGVTGSYNVSSLTDVEAGIHTINFVTAFSNVGYCVVGSCNLDDYTTSNSGKGDNMVLNYGSKEPGSIKVNTMDGNSSTNYDQVEVSVVIFGE